MKREIRKRYLKLCYSRVQLSPWVQLSMSCPELPGLLKRKLLIWAPKIYKWINKQTSTWHLPDHGFTSVKRKLLVLRFSWSLNSESTRSHSPIHLVKLHATRPPTGLFQEQLHGKTSYPCGHPHCSGQSEDKKLTVGIWSLDPAVLDPHHWEVHWWNSSNPHKIESPCLWGLPYHVAAIQTLLQLIPIA